MIGFVIGIWFLRIVDWAVARYFRKYHVQRIAYELLPDAAFWCMLEDNERAKLLAKARVIYEIGR